jgi:uncharacterized protein (TIGR02452 family)
MDEQHKNLFYHRVRPSSHTPAVNSITIPQTRSEIQQQTIQITKDFQYTNLSQNEDIIFDKEKIFQSIRENQMFSNHFITLSEREETPSVTVIYVDSRDCVDCAIDFISTHPDLHDQTLLLNLANPTKPGGGWQCGAKAQEEQLFRRSNYWQHIATNEYDPERSWQYPIPQFGGIFSPKVLFFRHSEENPEEQGGPYAFMTTPFTINCLAVAACQWPPLVDDPERNEQVLHPDYEFITKKKIQTIFSIAFEMKQTVLILSAFGCGAFQNPPQHIARLFQEVIRESFPHCFHTIIFSVYTVGAAASQYNYEAFLDIFGDENGEGKGCLSDDQRTLQVLQQERRDDSHPLSCVVL